VRFLLDTCALLWLTLEPEKVPERVRKIFQNPDDQFCVSVTSAWEIAIKNQTGRLKLPGPPESFLSECISGYDLTVVDIHLRHALRAGSLPTHHKDPFDRLLISQAQLEGLTIISADTAFSNYDIDVVW